jgi:glutathione synthase/RimK-type ligase-like ATP-grasp enzyme
MTSKPLLIIGRRKHGEKNNVAEMAARITAADQGVVAWYAYFEDVTITIVAGKVMASVQLKGVSVSLDNFSAIMLLHWTEDRVYGDLAFTMALVAQAHDIRVWNSEVLRARSRTKLSQLVTLALHGIPVPDTAFCLEHSVLLEQARQYGILPAVCKDITASRGRYNILAEDDSKMVSTLQELAGRPLIVQRQIPNDSSDIRFFVSGGKVSLVIRRQGNGESHLTNVSAGATAELVPLQDISAETLAEIEEVAAIFGRELCGIDYMLDITTNNYIFLEINGTPQIVNGVFVDEKIQAIINSLKIG